MTEQPDGAVRAGDARACGPVPVSDGTMAWVDAARARQRAYQADEAGFTEQVKRNADKITSMLSTGEIGPGLPPGYRFEFTRAKGPHPLDAAFTAQVRGTAPEPPPDGFLIPPGFAEQLRATIAELFGIPDEMLEPAPPPTWRTRLRRNARAWRERAARRAYKLIAGYWPDDGEDDW